MNDKNNGKVNLYLIRHGQTLFNKIRRTQGWCDSVLTKEGIEVAVNVGFGLSDVNFKAAYSSDLGRAVKSARIIIKENRASDNLELIELEGLREVYFGKYEGELEDIRLREILRHLKVRSLGEAVEKYHLVKAMADAGAAIDETGEAEDYNTAAKRIIGTLENICIDNSSSYGGNVLIVCHGAMLRLIIDYLDKSFDLMNMDNSSVTKIVYEEEKFKVEAVNDNSYSEKGKFIRSGII